MPGLQRCGDDIGNDRRCREQANTAGNAQDKAHNAASYHARDQAHNDKNNSDNTAEQTFYPPGKQRPDVVELGTTGTSSKDTRAIKAPVRRVNLIAKDLMINERRSPILSRTLCPAQS